MKPKTEFESAVSTPLLILVVPKLIFCAIMATLADALFVGSAAAVAVTVPVPIVAGAVNRPPLETVPIVVVQVTDTFGDPETVAANCCVPPEGREVVVGEIAIVTTAGMVATTSFE